jgi:ribosome-binding factor A
MSSGGQDHDVRVSRVAKTLRDIIANRIIRGLGDVPRGPVTITRVDVTRDFKIAKVYVSIFTPDGASEAKKDDMIERIFQALEDSTQELVRDVNKQLRLKNIPKFEFVLDTGLEKMARLSGILDSVRPTESSELKNSGDNDTSKSFGAPAPKAAQGGARSDTKGESPQSFGAPAPKAAQGGARSDTKGESE